MHSTVNAPHSNSVTYETAQQKISSRFQRKINTSFQNPSYISHMLVSGSIKTTDNSLNLPKVRSRVKGIPCIPFFIPLCSGQD